MSKERKKITPIKTEELGNNKKKEHYEQKLTLFSKYWLLIENLVLPTFLSVILLLIVNNSLYFLLPIFFILCREVFNLSE